MTNWQEKIVEWRFSDSLLRRIVGFYGKFFFEAGVTLGIPIALFTFIMTTILGVSLDQFVSVHPDMPYPRVVTWLVLTVGSWTQLRCFMTDGLDN